MNVPRIYQKILIVLLCIVSVQVHGQHSQTERNDQAPNIVFILADDLGIGDIGVYGQRIIQTPNIDQLAREGMRFNNFYAGSTVCAPSRASLLTGQHTGHTKVRGNGEFPLDSQKKILPELLKEAGYTNAMFGKWGLGLKGTTGSPEKRGWDRFLGHLHHVDAHFQKPDSLDAIKDGKIVKVKVQEGFYANDLFVDEALEMINNHQGKKPFFIYLSFTIPHAELVVPDRYLKKHVNPSGQSRHSPETAWPAGRHYGKQRNPKAAYAALVESLDDYVGMVVNALKEKGLDKNTLVIFSSDNGTHVEGGRTMDDVEYFKSSANYRGVKRDLYSGGIKEPFIAKWPGKIKPGTESDHTASFWDVYPTFAEMAGIDMGETEQRIDGISFLPTLLHKNHQKEHEFLYWEFHEFGGKQALLKGRWKAIRLNVQENPKNPIELYNIENDPSETNNVANKYSKMAEKLTRLMDGVRTPNKDFNFGRTK